MIRLVGRDPRVLEDKFAIACVLEQEDRFLGVFEPRIGDNFDEIRTLFFIELDVSIDRLWFAYRDTFASSLGRKDVDYLLWECVEESCTGSFAVGDDMSHRLRPGCPVVLLALCPEVHKQIERTKLLLRLLF